MIYLKQLEEILESSRHYLSSIKPSEWAEKHRVMTTENTPFPGPFNYKYSPWAREIVDCLSEDHPARFIAIKKGAQIGASTGIIESGIGFIIANQPGPILFLSGHQDLSEEAMNGKIDQMIDSCGLRHLIKPNAMRKRNQRTGDTSRSKEFPGGSLIAGSASNHKLLKQRSVRYGFIDDFDGAKKSSKESGNTRTLIEQRFAAYGDIMKLFYLSTPELKASSNIDPVFQLGDQRRFHIPCPCCGEMIPLYWSVPIEGGEKDDLGGIVWKLKENGTLDEASVKYRCQKCGDSFTDAKKLELLNKGRWVPMCEGSEIGYYSYHISSLYAPPGQYDWTRYVRQYLEACPPSGKVREDLFKTFTNVVLGETYEQKGASPEANVIQGNVRNYDVGIIPDKISEKDGNGKIIMLTCAADMNGREHDARLDYEIVAWSESGSRYAVRHGSIGTFIPRESGKLVKVDREHWTYEHNQPLCVWPELEKILHTPILNDSGVKMKILFTGIDTGHYTKHAYDFIDKTNANVVGLKGDKEDQFLKIGMDLPVFKPARERTKLYLLNVNNIKDRIAIDMELKWGGHGEVQPPDFMNFPTPSEGLYGWDNYFKHFQSEHRTTETAADGTVSSRWTKKDSSVDNHLWDCFDEKTEILTVKGWLPFSELTSDQYVATSNLETDEIEYQKPVALISKFHNGKMILIEGRKINICVTEEHRMICYRKKLNKATRSGRMSSVPEIVLAKNLKITDTIKASSVWKFRGNNYYIIPELLNKFGNVVADRKRIPSKVWAAFIGIYIAEGWRSKTWNAKRGSYAHRVEISQNKGKKFDLIKGILDQLPFKYNIYKTGDSETNFHFVITQKQLYLELENLGFGASSKRTGSWIKWQSVNVISEFLKFAILGDGYTNLKHSNHRKYYTISKLLADDIQELFIKTGNQSTINLVQPPRCKLNPVNHDSRLQYHISENKVTKCSLRDGDNNPNFRKIDYSGMVYCATVPNGTLICRREGKSFIAGNCSVYNYALREIWAHMVLQNATPRMKGNWSDFVDYLKVTKNI